MTGSTRRPTCCRKTESRLLPSEIHFCEWFDAIVSWPYSLSLPDEQADNQLVPKIRPVEMRFIASLRVSGYPARLAISGLKTSARPRKINPPEPCLFLHELGRYSVEKTKHLYNMQQYLGRW